MPKGNSKAATLKRMEQTLRCAEVLPQYAFKAAEWLRSPKTILEDLKKDGWWSMPLIVRSSAANEDGANASLAGKYTSVPDVQGEAAVRSAIEKVIHSYGSPSSEDEVLIQPFLRGVRLSGVAFSREPSSDAPYYVINYDDSTGTTDSVTSGRTNDVRTHYHYRNSPVAPADAISRIIELIEEVQKLLQTEAVDIEFAITADNRLFLLQARPLVCLPKDRDQESQLDAILSGMHAKVKLFNQVHPYLYGTRTVLGVMPDWNPAEIVGIRPKALALSLYCEIITDTIWAYQRDNYGYKNLRSFPLLLKLAGLPYIDVRVSFNSFIPADVDSNLSEKLANYYLDRLVESPSYHDKVEFEVVYSCYTFDLPQRLARLVDHGFSPDEIENFKEKLRSLTNRIIHGETGLWKKDIRKIDKLTERHNTIYQSNLDPVSKMYWLLEDCKRYGTLPFAGLARAGFIAVQMLRSLRSTGILSTEECDRFMGTLNTVSSQMGLDREKLSKSEFLRKYGHLRPGTYDILSPRYDEEPDRYFNWQNNDSGTRSETGGHKSPMFALSLEQMRLINSMLREHKLEYDVLGLFDFLKAAIEGREYAKFVFTRSLSDALALLKQFGAEHGFSCDDLAHLDASVIRTLYGSTADPKSVLGASIEQGREAHRLTSKLQLPALIIHPNDVYSFEQLRHQPNFVTLKSVSGKVVQVSTGPDQSGLKQSILFIPSADPGYDWIFSHGIAGFVTMYGGANSHMAIRAAELGIPAVIGSGETLYKTWSSAGHVELDCANRQVRILG